MTRSLAMFVLFLLPLVGWATHNRAGEITYTHLGGLTYEVVITTCTKTSVVADRPWLEINWGDVPFGTPLDSLERESITFLPALDAQINIYRGVHTYSGPGEYLIQMIDPNRNEGVNNIPNSVEEVFAIQSLLIINPLTGYNNSVQLLNSPKESACLYKVWQHNPGAFDPDGDLLVYSLLTNLGRDVDEDGTADPILGYENPADFTSNATDSFTIDPVTGTVTWDAVQNPVGEYNLAILIEEFREVNGQLIKVGHVIRDMQIEVTVCDNNPPQIAQIQDTCIVAFTNLTFEVTSSDMDGDPVNVSAFGGPLTQVAQPAFYTPGSNGTGVFSWTPTCTEIRSSAYQMVFSATDVSNTVNLTSFMTMNITVVAPPVLNPTVEPDGNSFILNWSAHPCLSALTELEVNQASYKIYRRQGFYGYDPDHCELGVPAYTGYQLVGTVQGMNNTSYVDTEGVFYGGEFCYMVVMCLADGSQSIASEEFCASIVKELPVMTNVSVEATDANAGEIYVAWSPATALDVENFPGPYRYELFHGEGGGVANTLVYSSEPNADLLNEDTTFTHVGLNTLDLQHVYRVNLWSGEDFVGSSVVASSVFLELEVDDQEISIFINHGVPWTNTVYEVYRRDPNADDFILLESVGEMAYVDMGLTNNLEYCYYVRTIGGYDAGGTIDPIENLSQIACASPVDLTPPCAPVLSIDADCENELATLTWTNPNNACEETDDTELYYIYYAPTADAPLTRIETITTAEDTTFSFSADDLNGSIAGCYAVSALDSLAIGLNGTLVRNESVLSNVLCVDNCPFYFLPNIFSPNNDGVNDVFTAFPWKFVDSVEFYVYNRWGEVVFETNDPNIGWNGVDRDSGEICTDGTYFYVAKVNTIRLAGIVVEQITGTITLVDGKNPPRE